MEKSVIQNIILNALQTGAEFGEVFYEETLARNMIFSEQRLDEVDTTFKKGMGIRISLEENIVYGYTNDLQPKKIGELVNQLAQRFNAPTKISTLDLEEIQKNVWDNHSTNHEIPDTKKKEILAQIDKKIRSLNSKINEVEIRLQEKDRKTQIGTSQNKLVYDYQSYCRIFIKAIATDSGKTATDHISFAATNSYDILKKAQDDNALEELVATVVKKIDALETPGGKMPVVINHGFGAVIFHEACGHSLEATTVAKNLSVLSNQLGKKIATDKVTIIDDGTIQNSWGSSNYDDEGNPTKKNVLIDSGVLTSYLVDVLNSKKMNHSITGSGRRESYKYRPTSRMNNTYLAKGTDKIEDMIKSISFGLYAKKMNGGSVDPITGDFNFAVDEGYLIKNGEIKEMVKGASLIGNTKEILNLVEMVSNDLVLEPGICGSESGNVPVTIGQPTIKVSSILVGGTK